MTIKKKDKIVFYKCMCRIRSRVHFTVLVYNHGPTRTVTQVKFAPLLTDVNLTGLADKSRFFSAFN